MEPKTNSSESCQSLNHANEAQQAVNQQDLLKSILKQGQTARSQSENLQNILSDLQVLRCDRIQQQLESNLRLSEQQDK